MYVCVMTAVPDVRLGAERELLAVKRENAEMKACIECFTVNWNDFFVMAGAARVNEHPCLNWRGTHSLSSSNTVLAISSHLSYLSFHHMGREMYVSSRHSVFEALSNDPEGPVRKRMLQGGPMGLSGDPPNGGLVPKLAFHGTVPGSALHQCSIAFLLAMLHRTGRAACQALRALELRAAM